jgi:hypothetical protein
VGDGGSVAAAEQGSQQGCTAGRHTAERARLCPELPTCGPGSSTRQAKRWVLRRARVQWEMEAVGPAPAVRDCHTNASLLSQRWVSWAQAGEAAP